MSLAQIRSAIVQTLSDAGLADHVEAHPGRLTADELRRLVVRGVSTVRVGCLGVTKIAADTVQVEFQTVWAVYIMALDGTGVGRDETAMALVGAIGALVPHQLWGRTDIDQPEQIRADNLYGGDVERRAVALWAITWRQMWTPASDAAATGLDDLLRVVAGWDLTGDDVAEMTDTIELEGGSST
jgi:hypothetical protein